MNFIKCNRLYAGIYFVLLLMLKYVTKFPTISVHIPEQGLFVCVHLCVMCVCAHMYTCVCSFIYVHR